jgi:hypothetical protein
MSKLRRLIALVLLSIPSLAYAQSKPVVRAEAKGPSSADTTVSALPLQARPLLSVRALFEIGRRTFAYTDSLTKNLRSYSLEGAPIVGVAAESFPIRGSSVMSSLGVFGDFRMALATDSQTAQSGTQASPPVSTTWLRGTAGLRARFLIPATAQTTRATLGASVAYRQEVFLLDEPGLLNGETARVNYQALRPALEGRVNVGPAALLADFAYLGLLATGGVAERLKGSRAAGVEGSLGIAFSVTKNFEARIGAEYTRYFYSFDPAVGDSRVAGGALDQMMRAQISIGGGL